MASLANQTISSTYDGLIKTSSDNAVPVSGVQALEDGSGNALALSVGRSGNGVSVSGNLAVDTNTLYVDAANNRVGIGESSPVTTLSLGSGTTGVSFLSASQSLNSGKIAVIKQVEVGNGNGHLTFETYEGGAGGGERMRIDSSGNVKINNGSLELGGEGISSGYVYSQESLYFNVDSNNTPEGSVFVFGTGRTGNTGGTELMRIDSSGNVGIGEQNPTAALTTLNGTGDGEVAIFSGTDQDRGLSISTFSEGGFGQVGVDLNAQYSSSATLTLSTGGSEAMRIDSSGNVGINCTPASGVKLQVNGDGSIFRLDGTANTSRGMLLRNVGTATAEIKTDGNLDFNIEDAGRTMRFLNGNTERMRITSGGDVCTGVQSITDATSRTFGNAFSGSASYANWVSWGSGAHTHAVFRNGTNAVGSIITSSIATAYNTSSDYRLKENVVPMEGALDRVGALKPSRFNFIADPETTVDGFLAHEVQAIVPEAVTGEKDAVDEEGNPIYQGIDQSKLTPLLTAALKEAHALIKSLEARIEILENK